MLVWDAEVAIDEALVRALLADEGWDNGGLERMLVE